MAKIYCHFNNCAHINAKNSIHLKFTSLADFTSCSSINYLDFIWQSFFLLYTCTYFQIYSKNDIIYYYKLVKICEDWLRSWCPVWCNNRWLCEPHLTESKHIVSSFFLHHACVFLDEFLILMKTVVWKLIILQW